MHSNYIFVFCLLFTILSASNISQCEEKGFSSALLCSSCDKLSAFVSNEDIVKECRECCLNDMAGNDKKVEKAELLIHPYMLGQYMEVNNFIDRYSKRYTNLVINTRANVATPRLRIRFEDKTNDMIQVSTWKTEQILEFCDSMLIKKE